MSKDLQGAEIIASDGCRLKGYHFTNDAAKGAILICCATAVNQKFYFSFARWLSEQGYNVLTFDYRGLGESLAESTAKDSPARKQEWGELDMTAAFSWLIDKHPDLPKHLIGHSAGGLLFGLMPNYGDIENVVSIGCSTGYAGNIRMPDRLGAWFFLKIYFPLTMKFLGYVPGKKLGLGEDLPKGIARQWADWCTNPGYVSNAFGKEIHKNYYQNLSMPMLVINMKDDAISTPRNVEALQTLFPNAQIETVWLEAQDYKLKTVGHMGFFRKENKVLWTTVKEWLERHSRANAFDCE
ncbi:MAG: alpha/beta fold hydrolase [Candidatus Obscuribacterales bacterium]|nr:alpha/beta fold hydrolase [Candidatus Obscuribacterales bacterium]